MSMCMWRMSNLFGVLQPGGMLKKQLKWINKSFNLEMTKTMLQNIYF